MHGSLSRSLSLSPHNSVIAWHSFLYCHHYGCNVVIATISSIACIERVVVVFVDEFVVAVAIAIAVLLLLFLP